MFAKINLNKNLAPLIAYHENKVRKGLAEFILAENFYKDQKDLSIVEKQYVFHKRRVLNEKSKRNLLHFNVEFDRSQYVSDDKGIRIIRQYMKAMSLGQQPYLVYRHDDTAHSHMHIVSTILDKNGKRKGLKLEDFYHSKKITIRLEKKFGLTPTDVEAQRKINEQLSLQPLQRGQDNLLEQMSKVLAAVMPVYKFTSLSEFNAILCCYKMEASRGKEGSARWLNKGLVYRPSGFEYKRITRVIKAGEFTLKPTLANLEKLFLKNQSLRQPHQVDLTSCIDDLLLRQQSDLPAFRTSLEKKNVITILKNDGLGHPENIWFIDQRTLCVFDAKELGGRYTVAALVHRFGEELQPRLNRRLPEMQQTIRNRLQL